MVKIDGRVSERGDIIQSEPNPRTGSEQAGYRPAIIIPLTGGAYFWAFCHVHIFFPVENGSQRVRGFVLGCSRSGHDISPLPLSYSLMLDHSY